MVMVPKLSVALTANYPAIEILQQGPAPSGTSSYHTPSRQQQRNAHNTAYTKLLTTLQHNNHVEGSGHLAAALSLGLPGTAPRTGL